MAPMHQLQRRTVQRATAMQTIARRMQSSNAPATARSSAIPVVAAIAVIAGGVALYSKSTTGSADHVGKAMAKSGTPAQTTGGLGQLDAESSRPLHMGGRETESNPQGYRPPSKRATN